MNSENLTYRVIPSDFNKTLKVPTSKSYANRALFLAAIDRSPVSIEGLSESTDVVTMLSCLKKIGLKISKNKNGLIIENSFPECEVNSAQMELELLTGDGGTTNRFLAALLARGSKTYYLQPSGHMRNRPMQDMNQALEDLGVDVESGGKYWLKIQGPINAEKLKNKEATLLIDSEKSTQFISAITMTCADNSINVVPKNMKASKSYFEMTLELIKEWRAGKKSFKVPVDFSSLSYPLALALVAGSVKVDNCHERDIFQADSVFLEIIKKMGGAWRMNESGLSLNAPESLKAIEWDCSGCPDLVPTLAFVCSYASGISRLKNLEVLRHKESDRIEEIINVLKCFEVDFSFDERESNLSINGNSKKIEAKEYYPPADHRIVMMTYLFMRRNSGGELHNAHHVAKSFPDFFELMA